MLFSSTSDAILGDFQKLLGIAAANATVASSAATAMRTPQAIARLLAQSAHCEVLAHAAVSAM